MEELVEMFWNASLEEMKRGYVFEADTDHFVCLVCGERFERGGVYPRDSRFYEAEKAAALHLADEHGSMYDYLLQLDKKLTGLSDLQKQLLRMFYAGMNDKDIVAELNGGSASTIRNHRFMLREKEKQAKLFLVLMELLNEKKTSRAKSKTTPASPDAAGPDNRFAITEEERQSIVDKYFPDGPDGELVEFPRKDKRKYVVLTELMKRFERKRRYSEKEVNEIIQSAFDDFVTIRRYLIDFGFMDRRDDGSEYWVKEPNGEQPRKAVGRPRGTAKERAGTEAGAQGGVFRLINRANGKMLVESTANMHGAWNRLRFGLQTGLLDIPELQRDWNEYGEQQFEFEVLDVWEPEEGAETNTKERRLRLKEMERLRLEELQPYGERGYNTPDSKGKSR